MGRGGWLAVLNQKVGISIASDGLFNLVRYTAGMPLLPSAFPRRGKQVATSLSNSLLNSIASLRGSQLFSNGTHKKIPRICSG